jgi:hypothetical protein
MRFNPVHAAVIGAMLICWSYATLADPLPDTGQTAFGDAPVGHLQPRASEFLPDSAAEKAVHLHLINYPMVPRGTERLRITPE